MGKTTSELQTPTGYTGIYADWNVGGGDPWDFGTTEQYPVLQVDVDGNGTASWEEFGDQRPAPDAARMDYDRDDDGLIEVASLAQLHAMRWDLDGNGFATDPGYAVAYPNAPAGMGCATGCTGYELTGDLDFDTNGNGVLDVRDAYWNDGAGWEPIGNRSTKFAGTFEGNGHEIANLLIDRNVAGIGLFGGTTAASVVRNVGLRAIDVSGAMDDVGGLVGWHEGTIEASYATGTLAAGPRHGGGLVGRNARTGTIRASYASVRVMGAENAGGLVGENGGAIRASYASGTVAGTVNTGGLAGWNPSTGTIEASYATGAVTGTSRVGGLVGRNAGTVTASYWDTATSGRSGSAGGVGKTTSELQTPTGYTGIYADWDVDIDGVTGGDEPWAFGTASQYPVLQVDFDGNGTASWGEFGDQQPVPGAAGNLSATAGNTRVVLAWQAPPEFTIAQYPIVKYQYRLNGGTWTDIPNSASGGANATSFAVTNLNNGTAYRFAIRAKNAIGNGAASQTVRVTPAVGDYDTDDDGLIEVSTLAQLDAMRWDLDGDGTSSDPGYAAAFLDASTRMGCPATGCTGYELSGDLDFDTNGNGVADASDPYWNDGAGWEPIGPYTATFEGNGHTIANLFIARSGTDEIGLFSRIGSGSVVRHVGLRSMDVRGRNEVGGLVGDGDGTIRASYASGAVTGADYVGGLAGRNDGTITTSYASGAVAGDDNVGGLAGRNYRHIRASYASSSVTGAGPGGHSDHGGLVGRNEGSGRISASYAWGRVTETHGSAGGLVGSRHDDSRVTASYWDTATTGQTRSAGGTAKTTSELQTPTGYSGIYADWNVDVDGVTGNDDPWHFGSSGQYPVLQVDFDGNGTASWAEFGDQRPVPSTPRVDYDVDDDGLIEVASLAQLSAMRWDLDGNGFATDAGYAAAFPNAPAGMGCLTGCTGYELATDLDFDTNGNGVADVGDASWNDGAGWKPIGTYSGIIEGNGHTLANLFIARSGTNEVGLFSRIGSGSVIRNVGLRGVDITGRDDTGGLVGENDRGTIQASYAIGAVMGADYVGGLVGNNRGHIRASYASGAVAGDDKVGGLAGYHGDRTRTITASYASSEVTGAGTGSHYEHGGLVGRNDGRITASYAWGRVTETHGSAGGLVGSKHDDSRVTASYWDTATSGRSTSRGGVGKTTSELHTPTGYSGIYADWNVDVDGVTGGDDPWHFGTASEYPVLQVDVDGNGTASWQEFGDQRPAPDPARVDYDADDDGLIEVASLAQLDAMRWDLDGDGFASEAGHAAAFPSAPSGMGCLTGCTGYELAGDLDFDTNGNGVADASDAYWNAGAGWEPINRFSATFEGNGHTLANLFIDRPTESKIGLFGATRGSSVVRSVGLRGADVRGRSEVGGLVGDSEGTVSTSYVSGTVRGSGDTIGGLVGRNEGRITASYASGSVAGPNYVGGLAGSGNGQIIASYASGSVTGADGSRHLGGLVGRTYGSGRISASYAWGRVTGTHGTVGGLVGSKIEDSRVTTSYWDTATTGQSASAGGTGKTTSELQMPTDYSGIYADWNVDIDGETGGDDPWHFGTSSQYPVLKVDVDGNGTATWQEFGRQYANSPPEFAEGATAARTVEENTAAGENIGDPMTATDIDEGDIVTYALSGTDAASFDLDTASGQLQTSGALDYEAQAEHVVTITASDNHGNSSSITVMIGVGDLVDTPTFVSPPYMFPVSEDAAVDAAVGTVTATPLAGGTLTYAITADDSNGAFAINATTGAITVAAALDYETTASYALTVTVSEAAGAAKTTPVTITVTDVTVDYDADDDGLIAVAKLAQLNAIRWDLDGDGTSTEAGYALAFHDAATGMGCPATGCTGYELTQDLDVDTDGSGAADAGDAYWNGGAGWAPLGDHTTDFNTTFEGNGHMIANLFIARGTMDYVGLFGETGTSGVVRHVGLRDADVTGRYYVGGLVGWNDGTVRGSFVDGQVTARSSDGGGLVGFNNARIVASYAMATVDGGGDSGGLAGSNGQYARILASYAGGTVTGSSRVGGLVVLTTEV